MKKNQDKHGEIVSKAFIEQLMEDMQSAVCQSLSDSWESFSKELKAHCGLYMTRDKVEFFFYVGDEGLEIPLEELVQQYFQDIQADGNTMFHEQDLERAANQFEALAGVIRRKVHEMKMKAVKESKKR